MNALPATEENYARYARQIGLSGFGLESQHRLGRSHAAVSRSGGVGGTIAMHLARAGIGELTLAHGGKLETEALNRMPLVFTHHVGRTPASVHAETLDLINPDVQVNPIAENVTEDNIGDVVAEADVVVDGAPLFEERYLLNRAAVERGIPLVSGAMYDSEGYVMSVLPGKTACFACINPVRPPYWDNIYVFPAISPGPAMVGAMAAMEVIKILTGCGDSLAGKIWFFDMGTNRTRIIRTQRRPDCEVCGDF